MVKHMGEGIIRMMIANLGTEILYSFIIIVCSLMIYFGTKDLYDLSKHKGIKYFRLTFLFFALAYFSRSFIKFIVTYFNTGGILSVSSSLMNPIIGRISLFFFVYLSTMAIFYLIYSITWKKLSNLSYLIYLAHFLAILVSFVIILTSNGLLYLYLNLALFVGVLIALYTCKDSEKGKQKLGIHATYTLLAFFWILNTVDLLLPNFFQTTQILIYLASSGIFMLMLYKVLTRAGK